MKNMSVKKVYTCEATLASHKSTVNCFTLSVVTTEFWKTLNDDTQRYGATKKLDDLISFIQKTLLLRVAQPANLVNVTKRLTSSGTLYITG